MSARDELARQLRAAGHRDAARQVAALAAALDQRLGGQPARPGRPNAMAELLDAGATLRVAQQDALAG